MLALVTFGGLALLMRPEWKAAAAISAAAALAASLWYYLARHRSSAILVDDEGIGRAGRGDPTRIRWVDVKEVAIGETLLPQRDGVTPVRFCHVRGLGSRRIAFADLTYVDNHPVWIGPGTPTPVMDVADSDLLLGIVADRVGDERFLPDRELEDAHPDGGDDEAEATKPASTSAALPRRRIGAGLVALVATLGVKLLKPVIGLFKGTQGILAVVSAGALALLWSWQGAIALMGMLLFHEYGHVHAMRRSGVPVKGIYFIPLVGAAAVAEDLWKTRGQQAYIALSGPLWGAALTAVPLAVVAATGDRYPMAAAVAGLWALVNLFNLLPINPLDGGRILSAVSHSVHGRFALALSAAALLLGVGAALWAGLHLFAILGVIGLLELTGELSAAARLRRMTFAPSLRNARAEEIERLRVLTRPGFPEPSESKLRSVELLRIRRHLALAHISPMYGRHAALWLGAYLLLAAALAGALFWVASVHPDLRVLMRVLQ